MPHDRCVAAGDGGRIRHLGGDDYGILAPASLVWRGSGGFSPAGTPASADGPRSLPAAR